jgi:hypothetical protein
MRKLFMISLVCATGAFVLTASPRTAKAYEEGVAGFVYDKDASASSTSDSEKIVSLSVSDIPIPGYSNVGLADVDSNLLIRSGPGENNKIIGKLPKNGGCEILDESKGWSKIRTKTSSSKELTGYVNSDYLLTGTRANRKAKEVGSYVATAKVSGLNVRLKADTDAKVVDNIAKGEELIVLDSKVTTDDKDHSEWVKVSLDSDTKEGSVAYVAREYVGISFDLIHAVSNDEISYGSGVSSIRARLINEAKEHLGESYVWGGTRLGHGVDCSGFMQQLYRQFGYYIPRDSRSQAASGRRISSSELRPGDLVFYGSSSYINHVAMYIGNGQVIHASNHRDGIKISYMYYRSPVKYARYISQ